MSDPTSIVKPKNSLLREQIKADCIVKIANRIQAFPQFASLRNDLELLTMCCNIVEHLIDNEKMYKKTGKRYDKKEIVLLAYEKAYRDLPQAEKQLLDRNIEYLYESGAIKKLTKMKVLTHAVCDWFSRRIA